MIPTVETVKATLNIYRNLPWAQKLQYLDADGRPINLTGWEAKLVVSDKLVGGTALHTFSHLDGSIVLGNGTIELKIPLAATINAFTWTTGIGHLVLQQPGELPKVVAFFAFTIQPSTTDEP